MTSIDVEVIEINTITQDEMPAYKKSNTGLGAKITQEWFHVLSYFLNTLIALEILIGKKCKMSLVLMVKLLEYHVSGCMITNVINLAFYVQLAFLHRDTWQLCIISCKDFFTNCIINVAKNTVISSKFRKNLYVYLPVQRVFLLRVKRGHCVYV